MLDELKLRFFLGFIPTNPKSMMQMLAPERAIVGTNDVVVLEDFETKASAPTNRAVVGISWMLKNTILIDGETSFILAAVSNPFIPGILTSRITTSGDSSGTMRIASAPFRASPQTWNESLLANSIRTPVRTTSWSSTIKRRAGIVLLDFPKCVR